MLAIATLSTPVAAQSADTYRAEIVVLERKVSPSSVVEEMASRSPVPARNLSRQLWVEDAAGDRHTTVKLVPRSQMQLNSAASRLENSGRYRVLMTAAWHQSFPPGYNGQPMQIGIGNWLPEAGHRGVEGQITIDRKRYLHVNVELNHWLPGAPKPALVHKQPEPTSTALQDSSIVTMAEGGDLEAETNTELPEDEAQAQLLTWIHEMRRMRSAEIHFLDSPTIGVLVLFRKI